MSALPPSTATYVKRRPGAPPGFFAVEAAGLAWLAEAEAAGGPRVARVHQVTDVAITLERIDTAGECSASEHQVRGREFGRALATLHRLDAGWFGCPPGAWTGDGFIGPLALPHVPERDEAAAAWGPFYARYRLAPFLALAERSGSVDDAGARAVRQVMSRLTDGDETLTGPPEPPARLHGDLWSGNVLWTARGAVLIDPAAHGGHRETDLAMLALFGLRGLDDVLTGYRDAFPPAPGWRDRVAVHQLHPLLVHAALFGAGYGADVTRAATRIMSAR